MSNFEYVEKSDVLWIPEPRSKELQINAVVPFIDLDKQAVVRRKHDTSPNPNLFIKTGFSEATPVTRSVEGFKILYGTDTITPDAEEEMLIIGFISH